MDLTIATNKILKYEELLMHLYSFQIFSLSLIFILCALEIVTNKLEAKIALYQLENLTKNPSFFKLDYENILIGNQ